VLARAVSADPLTMSKLLASGIDFAAPPTPVNVLGLVVTFAYLAFLWRMSSRMLQVRLSPPLLHRPPLSSTRNDSPTGWTVFALDVM